MINERIFEGLRIFDIDRSESFKIAVSFFNNMKVNVVEYYPGFFDSAYYYFDYLGIHFKLEYSGFFGTELKVSENISEVDLFEVRQWVKQIYDNINNYKV